MSLIDTIKNDQITARKNRSATAASLLTTLLGEANMVAKNAGREKPTDDEVIAVLRKFLKGNAEVQANVKDQDRLKVALDEALILEAYLPKQISEDEIKATIDEAYGQGLRTIGGLMSWLKERHGGQFDGKLASQLIKAKLG